MIECVFTLDYEIYGNGHGSLTKLVYEPAERLREVFADRGKRFVNFVEVAELDRIAQVGSDPGIANVERQVRDLHEQGFETALHIHPQWYNAVHSNQRWYLDYTEYNLCTLPRSRIVEIVDRALAYLRRVVGDMSFAPLAFRAGNWLFQPTGIAAEVLAERGIRIDSSVFLGGVQYRHGLDYRPSQRNGDWWRFVGDVNVPDETGRLIEVPIHTRMVPFWEMVTSKRLGPVGPGASAGPSVASGLHRLRDFARLRYPLKFDYCRMSLGEMKLVVDRLISAGPRHRRGVRPIVAIGHTKDFTDAGAVEGCLDYLERHGIPVVTFSDVSARLL